MMIKVTKVEKVDSVGGQNTYSNNIYFDKLSKSLGFKNDNSCNVFSYSQTRVSSLESPKHCVRLMLYINYTKALLKT